MANIPPSDLGFIQESLHDISQELLEAFDYTSTPVNHAATAAVLVESLEQLLAIFTSYQRGVSESHTEGKQVFLEGKDINTLAYYGISLFADLTDWAGVMHASSAHDELRRLGFGFGLWLAQHGVEIVLLAPLVDNIAFVASELSNTADFAHLYAATSQIMDAVSPALTQQDTSNRNQAWNILALNRAKIAIQSCHPPLMEQAFEYLIELLPDEAPNFFRECVAHTETAQYPEITRAVVEKYFRCIPKTLH